MKTQLLAEYASSAKGRRAEAILRSCVHCGFCNATCPTYQLLGDERDGPRGRIYQIKQVLEGQPVDVGTRLHLDRCLTCRNCETTCPSGVQYGELLDIGRELVDHACPRPAWDRLRRWVLRQLLPYPRRFGMVLRLGQRLRGLLPATLAHKVPPRRAARPPQNVEPGGPPNRRMLLLDGCVQQAATPDTNAAVVRVLRQLGIDAEMASGCCGAVSQHLNAGAEALDFARRNIDHWWPQIESGCAALISSASGCGVMVKDYGRLLQHDPAYATRAARVAAMTRDIAEVLAEENLPARMGSGPRPRLAYHPPCTLQHGQRVVGVVESLLRGCGYELTPVADAHLCCGSAGTYSLLQPQLAGRLREAKVDALLAGNPQSIVTANVGCELHLEAVAGVPVQHWIHAVECALAEPST